jgi:ribonucleoside-diphosphate reductase beta chain
MSIGLKTESTAYKPFRYPWAYDAWKKQQQIHWMPEEVQLGEDIKDWRSRLTAEEREFLTTIFRFFTQADIDVNSNYLDTYSRKFKPNEIRMMLSAFANMETVHTAAYALLVETVGMPESDFSAFMKYDAMLKKHEDSMAYKDMANQQEYAPTNELLNLAYFGGFVEGMQLYASFAMLMNFQRRGLMKGMCQIVEWSIRDESLHCDSILKLFRTLRHEYNMEHSEDLKRRIRMAAIDAVRAEDAFIDLAFQYGEPKGITKEDMHNYVRYIADERLQQMGYEKYYYESNPLPWLDELIHGVEHANFFETRATEYSKGSLSGTWNATWQYFDKKVVANVNF